MAEPSVDPSWIAKAADWVWAAVCGGVGWMYNHFDKRVDSKTDKTQAVEILQRLEKTNGHIEQLYRNAESDRKFTRDLHDEQMKTVSLNQREIIAAINRR